MSLKDQLTADLKAAMKAKDASALSAIRLLKAEITKAEIAAGKDIGDAEIARLVDKALKQRRESIEIYRKAGREDLAQKEESEAAILAHYQPEQLSQEALEELVAQAIAETGATGMKQMGLVIKACMAKVAGRADGKTVSEMVKKKLV